MYFEKNKSDLLSISQVIPDKVGVFYQVLKDLNYLKNNDFNVKNF